MTNEEQVGSRTRNESGDRTGSVILHSSCLWPSLAHTFGVMLPGARSFPNVITKYDKV